MEGLQGGQELSFQYEQAWLENGFPISISLPLQVESYSSFECIGFFEGLLPEGNRRQELAMSIGISIENLYGLLASVGRECAGALSILPGDQKNDSMQSEYEPKKPEDIIGYLQDNSYISEAIQTRRLSLAGAQRKIPIYINLSNEMMLPIALSPSTHLLKIGSENYPELVYNEFLCLSLAQDLGLTRINPRIFHIGNVPVLVVERYDRLITADGVKRLHQEDLAQAMGYRSSRKYESEGGPKAKELFSIMQHATLPGLAKIKLLKGLVLSWVIGNDDCHAKNIALLYKNKTIELAPFYDIVCTRIYPNLSQALQPSIGGCTRLEFLEKKHLENFCMDAELSLANFKKLTTQFLDVLQEMLNKQWDIYSENMRSKNAVDKIKALVVRNCTWLQQYL